MFKVSLILIVFTTITTMSSPGQASASEGEQDSSLTSGSEASPMVNCEGGLEPDVEIDENADPRDIAVMQALIKANLARTHTLRNLKKEDLARITVPIYGEALSGPAVVGRLVKRYRTWERVFLRLGLSKPRNKKISWTVNLMVDAICAVAAHSELSSSEIRVLKGAGLRALREVTGNADAKGHSLLQGAISLKELGSWDAAVAAALEKMRSLPLPTDAKGLALRSRILERLEFHRLRSTWGDARFHLAMTALVRAYRANPNTFRMNAKAMEENTSPEATAALQSVLGPDVTTNALIQEIRACGGTWDLALQLYGLNPDQIRLRGEDIQWSTEFILRYLKTLYAAGFDMAFNNIANNDSAAFQEIGERITGKKVNGAMLISALLVRFPHYSDAIREAGLPYGVLIPIHERTALQLKAAQVSGQIARHRFKNWSENWRTQLRPYLSNEFIDSIFEIFLQNRIGPKEDFFSTILVPYLQFWKYLLVEGNELFQEQEIQQRQLEEILLKQGPQLALLSLSSIVALQNLLNLTEISLNELRQQLIGGQEVMLLALRQLEINSSKPSHNVEKRGFFNEIIVPRILSDPDVLHELVYRMMWYF